MKNPDYYASETLIKSMTEKREYQRDRTYGGKKESSLNGAQEKDVGSCIQMKRTNGEIM